jgi:hypothetical protein
MPSTTITRGNILSYTLVQISITPAATAANTSAAQTFSVPGLVTTDIVHVSCVGAQTAGIFVADARVSAANTLSIQFANCTGTSATAASGNYIVEVIDVEGPYPSTAN